MCKWSVCLLLFGFALCAYGKVTIKDLSGTDNAEIGSSITLKCEYESEGATGIEIKWFYNDNAQMVQWIPGQGSAPQAIGVFKEILDLHDGTLKEGTMHSSIRFKQLTYDQTGNYTCKVSAFEVAAEDSKTATMVVYHPASSTEFLHEAGSETLTCSVADIYPKPNIVITGKYAESNQSIPLVIEDELEDLEENLFNITKIYKYDGASLNGRIEFRCSVFIPDTIYNVEQTKEFDKRSKPGNESTTTEYPDYYDFITESPINATTYSTTEDNNFGTLPSASSMLVMAAALIALRGAKC